MIPRRAFTSTVAVLVAIVLTAVVAPSALAQRAAPSLQGASAFDPPSASIGDKVTFTVQVTHPDDVILKAATPNIKDLDVITVTPSVTTPSVNATQMTTFAYTLQPFVLGTLDTGPVRLSWLRADGSVGTFDVPGAKLVLASVRASNDQALRPLKPQVSIAGAPPAWVRPAIAAAVVLVLALIALLVLTIVRRRRANELIEAGPVDTSPERIARDALDALAAPQLAAQVDYQSYYGALALTVRTYLAARFGFNAHALTTRELERRMVSHGVDRWQARLVGGLLERCDDAVYARRYPEIASADHDLTVAYEIVELSRPRPANIEGQAALA